MNKLHLIRFTIGCIVLVLAIVGILGIGYPVKIFDLQITPLLQRILTDFSVLTLIILIAIIAITLLFGRLYCSMLCPLGIIQDIICMFNGRQSEKMRNYPVKYFIAAIFFGLLIGGFAVIIKYIDPYTIFTSALSLSIVGIISLILVGVLAFFMNRFFCSEICPVGALLGLISKFSLFKVHMNHDECFSCGMCERSCPTFSIDSNEEFVDNETCVKCFKCFSQCPKGAIRFGIEKKEKENIINENK